MSDRFNAGLPPDSGRLVKRYSYIYLVLARLGLLLIVLLAVTWPIPILFYDFTTMGADPTTWQILIFITVFFSLIFLAVIGWALFRLFYWLRFERKRQRAARGDNSLLAPDQAWPAFQGPPLPWTITYRPSLTTFLVRYLVILIVLIIVAFSVLSTTLNTASTMSTTSTFILNLVLLLVFGLLIVGLGIFYFWRYYGRDCITLTVADDGVTMQRLLVGKRFLAWRDIRLFAIDRRVNPLSRPDLYQFELAGRHTIVNWNWAGYRAVMVGGFGHPDKAQIFDQQMWQLFALVRARTGLALYDLSRR
ncbi:hypothetical protein [Dictyobacter kobayashii]|uniref:Uncharacterized protein n=1 Tax=Dictyobacter kobayashii TaxID=2014872 RepID=A0A402AIP2_9CHLR|nr:hypothetical protein [Dictyobacter kobayashii]GCE19001.1 hypothetical protein KDK_28010 [Dictyobacter kobayashii]